MTDAGEWARRVSPSAFARRPGELDLVAAEPDPGYREAISGTASQFADAQTLHLDSLERRWKRSDPVRARPSVGRSAAILASVVAAAIAFALVYSRAHLDLESIAPWFAGLIAASVLSALLAVLPIRRVAPPSFRAVVVSGVGPAAAVAGIADAAFGGFPGGYAWWIVASATAAVGVVLLGAVLVARFRAPEQEVASADASRDDRESARQHELEEVARVWTARLEQRWAEVDPAVRDSIRDRLRDATRVLVDRELVRSDGEHTPGLLVLEAEFQLRGRRLDPSLDGFPDPR